MLETPHVIVGAAIAAKVGNPFLAIPLAFTSHLLLDMVPHWNPHLNTELRTHGSLTRQTKTIIVADSTVATLSAFAIASTAGSDTMLFITILLGGFSAALPDLLEAPYYLLHYKAKWMKTYIKWQKSIQRDAEFVPGVLTQLAALFAALWWLI